MSYSRWIETFLILCAFPLHLAWGDPSESAKETVTAEQMKLVRAAEARRVGAIDRVYGAVVAVYGENRQGGGSAVIYDPSGFALTNHHVVAGAGKSGWGGLADGKLYRWTLVGTDPGGDVAIIKLTGKDRFPAAPLGNSDLVRVGDWAMAMGNPFLLAEDQNPTATLGIVSGIKRYQPGAGLNTLVYGNCIQIDSSINPGNSGGPLFNIQGEVIGINGRGSFKERGRVNVGLGYAISSNQIKNFLPELLATKIAQHGTLDAVFDDREGKVVCETINLDAPVADLGLDLGDELLEFEGVKIDNANQFTNIISTLPAEWPAHLVFRHKGEEKDLWVRLYSLPYKTQKPQPQKGGGDKGKRPGPKIPIVDPGTIRDEKLNEEYARHVVAQWKSEFGDLAQLDASVAGFSITDNVLREDTSIGVQQVLLARDGRFRVVINQDGGASRYGFDGESYWAAEFGKAPASLPTSKALLNPYISQLATFAVLFDEKPLERFGTVSIDGSDKAQRLAAYRLKTLDEMGDWFYIWLSVVDRQSHTSIRLLKSGPDLDGDGRSGAVTYSDWRVVEGLRFPYRRQMVRELSEQPQIRFETTNCEAVGEISEDEFRMPQAGGDE